MRPRVRATTSPAFEEAWQALPDTARLRSSKKEAYPAWARACVEIGEEAMLRAVRRYVSEDKDHKRECGAPGFHRWLKWGRYEHWMTSAATVSPIATFEHEEARKAVVLAKGEGFCRSYLDRCKIDGTRLIVATATAADKLKEVRSILKAHGFTGMVLPKRD